MKILEERIENDIFIVLGRVWEVGLFIFVMLNIIEFLKLRMFYDECFFFNFWLENFFFKFFGCKGYVYVFIS